MELLHPHCAGLDIHKETVVACVRHLRNGKVATGIKTFKTTTEELIALSDWLTTEGCTHIVMEATGVLLEAGLAYSLRRRVRIGAGQCRPRQKCAGAQDRR